jgi:hypothetical protein
MTTRMEDTDQQKMSECLKEIFSIFERKNIKASEAAALMGSILGVLCANIEENFPFISFFTSFTRSYHANCENKENHFVTDPLHLFGK